MPEHLVPVPHSYELSAEQMSCSWAPLNLNTSKCAPGRGKMQVSFSHVGTGGAQTTLSLGTWPSEGEGYADALGRYKKVQSTLQPLRGRVGSKDTRVQKVKLGCQQAAKAACARADLAKVCLVLNVSALCSAYPQPTLYPRILSHQPDLSSHQTERERRAGERVGIPS